MGFVVSKHSIVYMHFLVISDSYSLKVNCLLQNINERLLVFVRLLGLRCSRQIASYNIHNHV